MKIELIDGKYTVLFDVEKGCVECGVLRYGEPWRDVCGDNLINAMAARIVDLQQAMEKAASAPGQDWLEQQLELARVLKLTKTGSAVQ